MRLPSMLTNIDLKVDEIDCDVDLKFEKEDLPSACERSFYALVAAVSAAISRIPAGNTA